MVPRLDTDVPVQGLIRKYGISEQTFYRWRKQYGGPWASELQELEQLRDENRRLRGLVVNLTLDKQILQELLSKKVRSPGTSPLLLGSS